VSRELWPYRCRSCCLCIVSNTLTTNGPRSYFLISPRITSPLLLISLGFLVGGFAAINRFGTSLRPPAYPSPPTPRSTAPEPMQVGDHVITQKSLYTALFVIGLPLLWWSSPISTFFWLVGASSVLILGHATVVEPGIESEYATVQDSV
jgi:PRA1 family protein 1